MGLVNGRQFTLRRLTDFEEPVPFLTFLSLPHVHIFVSFPPHSQLSAVCNRFTLVLFLQLVLTIEVLHLSKETSAIISFRKLLLLYLLATPLPFYVFFLLRSFVPFSIS